MPPPSLPPFPVHHPPHTFHLIYPPCTSQAAPFPVHCLENPPHPYLWLCSPSGLLRRFTLPTTSSPAPIHLPANFLTLRNSSSTHPVVQLDIGHVYSLSTVVLPVKNIRPVETCQCSIEVFASKGYARVSGDTGSVVEMYPWRDVHHAAVAAVVLTEGPLHRAVLRGRGFGAAVLTISLGGVVRAAWGGGYYEVCERESWRGGQCDLAELGQGCVFWALESKGRFLVLVGRMRGGIVLWGEESGGLRSRRFGVKGGSGGIGWGEVRIVEMEGVLVLEELKGGGRTGFRWGDNGVEVELDWDRRLEKSENDGDYGQVLKGLLRGIRELGEGERGYEEEERRLDSVLASYSAALLFVKAWREGERLAPRGNESGCRVSVRGENTDAYARLQLPAVLLGRNAFVTVVFTNCTGVALGDGWMLRMVLCRDGEEDNCKVRISRSGGSRERVEIGSRSTHRVTMCPLEKVQPGEERLVSFPVTFDSHAPLSVSISLTFHHPTSFASKESPVDVSLKLCENLALDVLYLSRPTANTMKPDSSAELIKPSQLRKMLSGNACGKHNGTAVLDRVELPIPFDRVTRILNFPGPSQSFESLLGAQYTVTLERVSRNGTSRGEEHLEACTVTIRGLPHVVPFVRAAILRRILLESDADKELLGSIVVRERAGVDEWARSLIDTTDECTPSFRRAEGRLVEALRMFAEIDDGARIEHCFDEQENKAVSSVLQNVKSCYGMWRRQTERMLVPAGITNTKGS